MNDLISYYNFSKIALFWIDHPEEISKADTLTLLEFFQAFVINVAQINQLPIVVRFNIHVIFEDVCVVLLVDRQRLSFDIFSSDCEFDFSELEDIHE